MATRGVYQLTKLRLCYSEVGGSSSGIRELLSSGRIVKWAEQHPHIDIEVKVYNGKHPRIEGEYLTGPPKQMTVKNFSLRGIYDVMEKLRDSSGRKMKRLNRPVMTQTPSVQGVWTPMLNLQKTPFKVQIVKGGEGSP